MLGEHSVNQTKALWILAVFVLSTAFLALAALGGSSARAAGAVDLELVFAADGSGSIDDDELRLQRDGYATALADPRVLDAIASGVHGRIVVAYIEWGGPTSQHTIVDWMPIASAADARAFGTALRAAPRAARGYNSISEAIAYSAAMIRTNDYEGARKVIDVSGDGPQIGGRSLDFIRDLTVSEGITINALVVANRGGYRGPRGEPLEDHYRYDVIGGIGAFVVVANQTRGFTDTLLGKMIREIVDAAPTGRRVHVAHTESTTE
ncbi:MAG: DUF1194 domain-containing protein [Alphaproteobacteria bacterium]|nr:DUF1194 domain-containing protein [Alphaproteobacteria bacterium]